MMTGSDIVAHLTRFRDLIEVLVARDLKLRYKRSALGLFWSLLNPLLQLLVFYFVFRYVLPVAEAGFALFLFTGLLAWNWFQSSLQLGCNAITDHASLVRQPGFQPAVLPLVTVLSNLLHFLIAFPIVIAGALIYQHFSWPALLSLPVVIFAQLILTLAIVYGLAALHVTLGDTQYLVSFFLLLAFYLSPVLYAADRVPARFRSWYRWNPLVPILDGYHRIIMEGKIPHFESILLTAAIAAAALVITYRLFGRASQWFVEEIGS